MAFFSARNGTRYFNCFYYSNKQNFSGTFYSLTESSAKILSTVYIITAAMAACVFVIELLMPLLLESFSGERRDLIFAIFFILNAFAIMPAAIIVTTKKKEQLSKATLQLEKNRSIVVYACIILVPTNYTLMMIWKAVFDKASQLLPAAVAMTILVACAAAFRIRQILRAENAVN